MSGAASPRKALPMVELDSVGKVECLAIQRFGSFLMIALNDEVFKSKFGQSSTIMEPFVVNNLACVRCVQRQSIVLQECKSLFAMGISKRMYNLPCIMLAQQMHTNLSTDDWRKSWANAGITDTDRENFEFHLKAAKELTALPSDDKKSALELAGIGEQARPAALPTEEKTKQSLC